MRRTSTKRPTRTLVVGGAGWGNVGDDLIASRIVERLTDDAHAVAVAGGRDRPSGLPDGARHLPLVGSWWSRALLVAYVVWADQVVIGGGGLLADRVEAFYRPFHRVARLAHLLHTPYRLTAVGVSTVRRDRSRRDYRWMVEHAAAVSVRDEASRDRLTATGALRPVAVEADPALWPTSVTPTRTAPSYDLVINLRPWSSGATAEQPALVTSDDVVRDVATAVEARYGDDVRIALVSMSVAAHDNDVAPLDALAARLPGAVDKVYGGNVRAIEGIVADAGAVLSMRLHLALISVAQGTPVAGLAYDEKVAQQGALHGFPSAPLDESFDAGRVDALLDQLDRAPSRTAPGGAARGTGAAARATAR